MFKYSLSRRDFLKSMGVGIAALNLPLSINIVDMALTGAGIGQTVRTISILKYRQI